MIVCNLRLYIRHLLCIKTNCGVYYTCYRNSHTLFEVNLEGNPLGPAEESIFYSNTVFKLYLANCNLSNLSSLFFSNIRQLQILDLSGNPLQEIKPRTFYMLDVLSHLNLNNCNLTYIHSEAFKGLKTLETLKLNGNILKNDVDWTMVLHPLQKLITLEMRHSAEPKFVTDTFFRNTMLRNVVLAENDLSNINVSSTHVGEKSLDIQFLDLSYCNLKEPLTLFGNTTELSTLILAGNPLIPPYVTITLRPLLKLTKLSLRDCGLKNLPDDTFDQMTSLKELDVSENPWNVDTLATFLSTLKQLEHLDIGYSGLEIIKYTILSRLSSLKSLVLSGNKIDYIEKNAFKNLKYLRVLEMNNCGLRHLSIGVFNNNFQFLDLTELRVSGNPFMIPVYGPILSSKLFNLTNLDMSKCKLDYLPADFFMATPNIKKLLLNGNELTSYKNDMLFAERLTRLEELDLSYNNMTSFDVNKFKHNSQLTSLKLVGNPWVCECELVDVWNWAASSKVDIGVLINSTELYSKADTKKPERLVCSYDVKRAPEKEYMLRRPSTFVYLEVPKTKRTWQRYLRNANCSTGATGEL